MALLRRSVMAGLGFSVVAASLACSRTNVQVVPDAGARLESVRAADPTLIANFQESKHWSNPYLVVRPSAVGLLTGVTANEEQMLKPQEVLPALAQLPGAAWPYGRAVAILVDEKATNSQQDKAALLRNKGIVAGELASAHVAIHWIPSS